MSKGIRIVIVGAGAAGIAAASRLVENGFEDVKILEAEDRIGGRIHSLDLDGSMLDFGAQWVHGEDGNVVYELAKNFDLLGPSSNNYDENTFFCPSLPWLNEYASELYQIGLAVLDDKDMALEQHVSLGEFFIKAFHDQVTAAYPNNRKVALLAELMQDYFSKFVLCYDSAKSWFEFTTHGAFTFEPYPGNQLLNWKKRGFGTLLDILMKDVSLEDKIHLNKEVVRISWQSSECSTALVECSDGSKYTADHVIVTLSVGVLQKQHDSLFSPKLPSLKVNSINGISIGTVNKIFLKFPHRWWFVDTKGFSFLWTQDDKKNLREEFSHCEPSSKGVSWLEEIFGFYVLDSHPDVLMGWVVGRNASDVELLSDEVVQDGCMYLLRKFAGDVYEIPNPEKILRTKWSTNSHFCGSYTYVSKTTEESKASADGLAVPLTSMRWKETLLFAGEATHPTRYSTVDGAVESGFREADRLINSYK